jgi:hypothetical protein
MALAMGLYLWQGSMYVALKEYPLAGVFCGYALSNAFFIWDYVTRLADSSGTLP